MSYYARFPGLFSQQGSSPPPGSNLIDGFETFNGGAFGLNWTDNSGTATVTQTTSHVTQGTYSGRYQQTATNFVDYSSADTFNTTGWTTILVDVYVATIEADEAIVFGVSDNDGGFFTDQTPIGTTGEFTLSVDVTGTDFTTYARFSDLVNTGGPTDFYFDNLRWV